MSASIWIELNQLSSTTTTARMNEWMNEDDIKRTTKNFVVVFLSIGTKQKKERKNSSTKFIAFFCFIWVAWLLLFYIFILWFFLAVEFILTGYIYPSIYSWFKNISIFNLSLCVCVCIMSFLISSGFSRSVSVCVYVFLVQIKRNDPYWKYKEEKEEKEYHTESNDDQQNWLDQMNK